MLIAFVMATLSCIPIGLETQSRVYRYLVIVDITRSMNVTDYRLGDRMVSRLDMLKHDLRQAILAMPCGSALGLGVFTERNSAVLFEPIEVCGGFQQIISGIEHLDWRMAWAADSRIAAGLMDAFMNLGGLDVNLVFLTDGQEAPPINPKYKTRFDSVRGRLKGLLVGVGGMVPSPIPKFDEAGMPAGVVSQDEVPHRSTFGLSEMAPDEIEGYHARNAPFGSSPTGGTEHMSSLREEYLQGLADESGLTYQRLAPGALTDAMLQPAFAREANASMDLRWIFALLSLTLASYAYARDWLIQNRYGRLIPSQLQRWPMAVTNLLIRIIKVHSAPFNFIHGRFMKSPTSTGSQIERHPPTQAPDQ